MVVYLLRQLKKLRFGMSCDKDVIFNSGTGIMDHPDGAAAGVRAFFEALAQADIV